VLLRQIWSFGDKPEDRSDGCPPEKFDPQTDNKVRQGMGGATVLKVGGQFF